jgi:Zn-dependent protease with chaperone function
LAALAAVVASLPLAAVTLIAAQPFARAAVRYRIAGIGFALVAAVGPLCALAAAWRTAPPVGAPAAGALNLLASPLLAALAAIGCGLLLGLARDVVRLRRIKRRAEPLGILDVRRARLGSSPKVVTPTAIGYLHPAVVVPDGFGRRVDEAEWAAVVAHECAHLTRWDDWAKALQSAVLRAGWWLPGLWMLSRALDLERELASDERAAAASGARRYAACLLRLATDRRHDALAPGLWSRRSHVAIRVERLLRPSGGGRPLVRAATLGAATAGVLAVVATAVLAVPGTGPQPEITVPQLAHVTRTVPRHVGRLASRPHRPTAHVATRRSGWIGYVPVRAPQAPRTIAPVAARPILAVPAAPAVPAVPSRRAPARRPAKVDKAAPSVIAFVPRRRRCPTCFGPLRSADDPVAAPSPPFPAKPVPAAITAPDPTSGPVDLGSSMVWYRLPSRAVSGP